eukprot:TRINITY_DN22694_c0_g1_i1.p1 TRINITY_DN22694_c0_g1~~TRINITY_DN22694_c0_g1_i1.p1  ORF type:complete len:226 (-),score=9.10 TRINITY_DN22694_c0_g1_i1:97-678(-)
MGGDAESGRPLVGGDGAGVHVYPRHMVWPLSYTAPLPFLSFLVAMLTQFYGLAILAFCLGITSVQWWWHPYRDNCWRTLDRCCICLGVVYCTFVGLQLERPWMLVWLLCIALVSATILLNESASWYLRTQSSEPEDSKEWYQEKHLMVHLVCAHVVMNVLSCTLMMLYCFVAQDPSIKFLSTLETAAAAELHR